jgi:hypothetical protein
MDDLREAEVVNTKVKTEDFNLDQVATEAILRFSRIKDRKLNQAVFAMIKTALRDDINPFTKAPLGRIPMPLSLVKDIMEYCETGAVTPKIPSKRVRLNQETVSIIKYLKQCGLTCANARKDGTKLEQIVEFCDKLLEDVP